MSEETTRTHFLTRLGSEVFLDSMVAILSISTAIAAYQGWRQEDISGDFEIRAIRTLTERNRAQNLSPHTKLSGLTT